VELTHLIDIGLWQSMLDSLSAELGTGIRILDKGREIVLQSGLADLCCEAMKHGSKHPACFGCLAIEDLSGYDQGGFALCAYCDRAINFVFNLRIDSIEGHVIIGPVWIAEEEGRPALSRLARQFGVGQATFARLSGKLRAYSLEEFRKAGEMMLSTMRVISQTISTNVDLVHQVHQMKESLVREKRKTWQQMIKDGLTGTYRYNYGLARLKQEVARAERYKNPLSIVVIGIEQFRSYVRLHGPEAARNFLTAVGTLVQKKCRRTDLSVRLSEEEFLVILPSTPPKGARAVLDRIRGEAADFSFSEERGVPVAAPSLEEGLASYPKDGEDGRELLRKALEKLRQ